MEATKFLTVSIKINEPYFDAFLHFWAKEESVKDELTFFCHSIWGMNFPVDAKREECEQEVIEYLARYHWHLGTHYAINK